MLKQISEGVEKILRDFLGFEKSFADVDQLCSGTWKISDFEKFYVDRSRNENEGKFSICTEKFLAKTIGCIPSEIYAKTVCRYSYEDKK